jgi:hypothetical protein
MPMASLPFEPTGGDEHDHGQSERRDRGSTGSRDDCECDSERDEKDERDAGTDRGAADQQHEGRDQDGYSHDDPELQRAHRSPSEDRTGGRTSLDPEG